MHVQCPNLQSVVNLGGLFQTCPSQEESDLLIFILTANGFSPGGSGTTIRHNTQTTHITQNNTRSNETQYTKIHTK
jgi:hypothetical protein